MAFFFTTSPTDNLIYDPGTGPLYRYESSIGAWTALKPNAGLVELLDVRYDGGDAPASGGTPSITFATGARQRNSHVMGSPIAFNYTLVAGAIQDVFNKTVYNSFFSDSKNLNPVEEAIFDITDGAGVIIDAQNGGIQRWTLTNTPRAPTLNVKSGKSMILHITAGSNLIDWTHLPIKWMNAGSAPALSTTGETVLTFWRVGPNLYGSFAGTTS